MKHLHSSQLKENKTIQQRETPTKEETPIKETQHQENKTQGIWRMRTPDRAIQVTASANYATKVGTTPFFIEVNSQNTFQEEIT